MRFKDQAIPIRVIDWSETSQIVSLLTREHGKLPGLAKGSRRSSPGSVARYSGGFELLTRGEIVGSLKPTAELATLTEWDLQDSHWHLRRDLRAQRLAMYGADLCGAMLADHDPHPNVFAAMSEFLLSLAEPENYGEALLAFQWRVLDDCGYRPEVEQDARTGAALPTGSDVAFVFDPRAGGLVTDAAGVPGGENTAGPWRVRGDTVAVLRSMVGDVSQKRREEPSPGLSLGGRGGKAADAAAVARANRLLCVYARSILDRELPTMEFVLGVG